MARPLTILQHGAISYAVCARCNGRLESKYLDLLRATEAIRRKYESHVCREIEDRGTLRDQHSTGSLLAHLNVFPASGTNSQT